MSEISEINSLWQLWSVPLQQGYDSAEQVYGRDELTGPVQVFIRAELRELIEDTEFNSTE
jgi:hypothetical protein